MEKIKIITDSTASIPPAILAQYPEIGIVPLYIQFGDKSFKEGIDITNAEFYTRQNAHVNPVCCEPDLRHIAT